MDQTYVPVNSNTYLRDRLNAGRQWASRDTAINYNHPQFIQNNMVMRSSGGSAEVSSSLIKNWLPLLLRFDDISFVLFVAVPVFRISCLAYFAQNVYKKILHLDSTMVNAVLWTNIIITVTTLLLLLFQIIPFLGKLRMAFLQDSFVFVFLLVVALFELAANVMIFTRFLKKILDSREREIYKKSIIFNISVSCATIVMCGYITSMGFQEMMISETQKIIQVPLQSGRSVGNRPDMNSAVQWQPRTIY